MSRDTSVEKNMAGAIYSMRLKARGANSTEQIILDLSKENRGVISKSFSDIIEKTNSGESFESAVDNILRTERSENMRKLLTAVKRGHISGDNYDNILKNLMEDFMKHKKIEITQYSDNIETILNLIILLMLVPVFIHSIGMMNSFGSEFIGNMDQIMSLSKLYLVFNVFIIALMLIFVKMKEPVI